MDPRRSIRNGFVHGNGSHSHFYAAWTSRHESSMIPKALKIATLQKKKRPHGHGTFVNHEQTPILPDAEYPMSTTALLYQCPAGIPRY